MDHLTIAGDIERTRYPLGEEIASSVIHGVGLLLAIGGLVALELMANGRADAWMVASCRIFGATLVLLYLTSTLYHSVPNAKAKGVLRQIDHTAIYLLIAGTYTPFTLVTLRGPWGWTIFGIVWALAALGVAFQYTHLHRMGVLRVLLFLLMGWTVMIAIKPLLEAMKPGGLALLFAGGAAYTLGVVFYAWRSLPYGHAVWHVFVLAGSAFHYFAVLLYVEPVEA